MSLKAFHIIFIILAMSLCAVCAAWSFANAIALPFGICCVAVGIILLVYGVWFIKKSRGIIT